MVSPNLWTPLRGCVLLLALWGSGCVDEAAEALDNEGLDTSVPLEVVDEIDTQDGYYHLEFAFDPESRFSIPTRILRVQRWLARM